MTKSKNSAVQKFIDEITLLDKSQYLILQKLREIVFEHYPETVEKMMYGGIIFSLDGDWGGVFVYKSHVSFEFGYGYKLKDPMKILEGNGKFRRHLKMKSIDEVEMKKVAFFIKQIQLLEE